MSTDSRTDVLVVGAGIVGCAIAHALAGAGCRARVVDMRAPGQGASQASAGVLAPYTEGHEPGPLREFGRRSLDLYDAWIARVRDESGLPVAYARTGTLEVALDAPHAGRLRASGRALVAAGVEAAWLEGADLRAVEPAVADDATGALLVGLHGYVGVMDLTRALAQAATRLGARIDAGVTVRRLAARDGAVVAETADGTIEAGQVVLAAGSWSSAVGIDGVAPVPVAPVRGQLLHVQAPPGTLGRVAWGADCYMVPWDDGTILVGATVEHVGFDERATLPGVSGLGAAATRLVPALAGAAFSAVRVGLRPGSPDELPLIGRSQVVPGLIYAAGHYRNGVLLAPLTARLVAALAAGGSASSGGADAADAAALRAFDPARAGRL